MLHELELKKKSKLKEYKLKKKLFKTIKEEVDFWKRNFDLLIGRYQNTVFFSDLFNHFS